MPKPHLITITELSRPRHGMITHHTKLPGWCGPVGTCSLEDAHKVAAGFKPNDGQPVEIRVKLLVDKPGFQERQAKRAAALGLRYSR